MLKECVLCGLETITGFCTGNDETVGLRPLFFVMILGLYIGGGTVIEAEGTIHGVVTNAVTRSKWTN